MTINSTTKTSNLTVSVIMPAYNAGCFIEEAIKSVVSQTMQDWELIVIDDCSTDDTCAKVEALAACNHRIRFFRNEKNLGVSRTRNRAIELAKGAYIAFLDGDDIWHPEKLEKQLEIAERKSAQIVYCSAAIIGSSGERIRADYLVPAQVTYEELLKENCMLCSAMFIRADVVKQFMFCTDFYHEDYVLGLQMLKAGYTAAGCLEVLLFWRYLDGSRSFNKWKSAVNRWRIYRQWLKLPIYKSITVFVHYTIAGLKKYFRRYS